MSLEKALTPLYHALTEILWSLITGGVVIAISVTNAYVRGHITSDPYQFMPIIVFGFCFAAVHGVIKLIRVSTDPQLQEIAKIRERAITRVNCNPYAADTEPVDVIER
jgi:hypothetical protein